jgi:biopolymer transport protein TolQ
MASPVVQNGLFDLVLASGPVGKSVLLLLLAVSVLSWAVILVKWRTLNAATRENQKFLDLFWHGKDLDEIADKADRFTRSPVASVFKSGVREFKRVSGPNGQPANPIGVENITRALSRASTSEITHLERHVSWLATTASAAPFVGLFGTVWGIMSSFQSIGASGQANLAVVAPGISEALITTATGIGAAIPAVIAYNHFSGLIRRHAVDMDCFAQDFLNIVQLAAIGRAGREG